MSKKHFQVDSEYTKKIGDTGKEKTVRFKMYM